MRKLFLILFCVYSIAAFSQEVNPNDKPRKSLLKTQEQKDKEKARKAPITSYRIVTINKDTTYVDTSLTIQDEYEYNYLRRDNFGLLPFLNEGQPYTVLDFGERTFGPYPEMGYSGKHFSYLQADDIRYYSVATPLTELYFKTVMQQGQSVDAFIALNTSEQLNFSVAYRGLRSLGRYINQLTSTGNFRFTTNYHTKDNRYELFTHFTGQDITNQENGGITTRENFESKDADFKERQRLEVYLRDAETLLKGNRIFFNHSFRVNPTSGANNLYLTHQFTYERKTFEYYQPTVASTIGSVQRNRFGNAFVASNINDQTKYNRMYNQLGAVYENATIGRFHFFAFDYRYNYYYNTVFVYPNVIIPAGLSEKIEAAGAQYDYRQGKWNGSLAYATGISGPAMANLDARINYAFNERNRLSARYQQISRIPDHIYSLHQSSYAAYNWYHDFRNEKVSNLELEAATQWAVASLQLSSLRDRLYFSDDNGNDTIQLVSPKQYGKTINYLSVRLNKEFRWWKLALDNTILYQKATQADPILNVPEFVTRNTLYFSDYFFTRALFLQTGITCNYFTKYYADNYNPVTAEFFVQREKEIGAFPMLDFFVNARIRQTRIFVKAEHFNSAWAKRNEFYAAPDYPFRDFLIRFGLVWNFFQ